MPTWRSTLDTLQIIDDLRILYKEWNAITGVLEPIAQSMDKWGVGGGTQAITSSSFLAK